MKTKLSILLFILSFSLNTKAQNLVSNGYFEIHDTCPNNISQINYATGWLNGDLQTTADYYNTCAPGGNGVGVPYNAFGYQSDCCGGSGYTGIYTFNKPYPNQWRDYIQTKLIDTLKIGHKYLASMYISRCNDYDYAEAAIGMLFTDTILHGPSNSSFISANPQVKNTTIVADTINWTLIQDTITAVGNEVYLTIGNFTSDALSDTSHVGGNGFYVGGAYYYIDGVSVYDVATLGIQQNKKTVEVNIYPNPANNKINVDANNINEIKLFDILGSQILSTKQKEIDVSNVSEGVYFIQVQANQSTYKQKIIVQH